MKVVGLYWCPSVHTYACTYECSEWSEDTTSGLLIGWGLISTPVVDGGGGMLSSSIIHVVQGLLF